MEETGGYYSKGNKPDKEQPKLHGLIYRLLKKKKSNLWKQRVEWLLPRADFEVEEK